MRTEDSEKLRRVKEVMDQMSKFTRDDAQLAAGEMTLQEWRTASALLYMFYRRLTAATGTLLDDSGFSTAKS